MSQLVISYGQIGEAAGGNMSDVETIGATEFKARCLELLDRVSTGRVERVIVTKRGAVVAMLVAPEAEAARVERLHGFMRGTVVIPPGSDLTAPVSDEAFSAEDGLLHG